MLLAVLFWVGGLASFDSSFFWGLCAVFAVVFATLGYFTDGKVEA